MIDICEVECFFTYIEMRAHMFMDMVCPVRVFCS